MSVLTAARGYKIVQKLPPRPAILIFALSEKKNWCIFSQSFGSWRRFNAVDSFPFDFGHFSRNKNWKNEQPGRTDQPTKVVLSAERFFRRFFCHTSICQLAFSHFHSRKDHLHFSHRLCFGLHVRCHFVAVGHHFAESQYEETSFGIKIIRSVCLVFFGRFSCE